MSSGSADESWEIEVDPEELAVRRWREKQLRKAGVDDFAAFRLSMAFDADLHRLVEMKERGVTDDFLIDMFID